MKCESCRIVRKRLATLFEKATQCPNGCVHIQLNLYMYTCRESYIAVYICIYGRYTCVCSICMFIYIYIYTQTYIICIYTRNAPIIYVYPQTFMDMCMSVRPFVGLSLPACMDGGRDVCTHACVHGCMYTCMNVPMHACMHACMCIYIYIYVYIYVQLYTYV